jgi:ABC-type phosphate transport system permease subunit
MNHIWKEEFDKKEVFLNLVKFFLENLFEIPNERKYLIGLFLFVSRTKELRFLNYNFDRIASIYRSYVETEHKKMRKVEIF